MKDNPMIVCVAANGARKTKADHTGLPLSADGQEEKAFLFLNG
jgi:uncharacterized protein (DUF849 family)